MGPNPPVECDRCAGTGRSYDGEIGNDTDTLDKRLDDLEGKVDDLRDVADAIFEKVEELE